MERLFIEYLRKNKVSIGLLTGLGLLWFTVSVYEKSLNIKHKKLMIKELEENQA